MSNDSESMQPVLCWSWDTGIGDTSIGNSAFLTDDVFAIRTDIIPFLKPKEVIIPLTAIKELRFSDRGKILEIHYSAKSPAVVWGRKSAVHREIFAALRKQTAPGLTSHLGTISPTNSIGSVATRLMISTFIGGLLLVVVYLNNPKVLLPCSLIVGSIVSAFACWTLFRKLRPHQAEVIVISGAPNSQLTGV